MSIHLTYTYLWVLIGIVWFIPAIVMWHVSWQIGEWSWPERLLAVFWPVGLVWMLLRAVFWWG